MKKLLVIIFTLVCVVNLSAQGNGLKLKGVGLTASLQTQHTDIMLPIKISGSVIMAPSIGLALQEDIGSNIALGVQFRFYNGKGNIKTFWGPRLGINLLNPEKGNSMLDIIMGLGFGGEYFFSVDFSVGVEAQLNVVKSDEESAVFGNPGGVALNTASVLFATVWL